MEGTSVMTSACYYSTLTLTKEHFAPIVTALTLVLMALIPLSHRETRVRASLLPETLVLFGHSLCTESLFISPFYFCVSLSPSLLIQSSTRRFFRRTWIIIEGFFFEIETRVCHRLPYMLLCQARSFV